MKIIIMGPILSSDLSTLINKKDLKKIPVGHGVSHLSNLALSLVELGYMVSIITLSPDIDNDKIFIYKNKKIKIIFCPLRKSIFRLRGVLFRKEVNFLTEALNKEKSNVIHSNWIYEYALAAWNSKRKYILTSHDIPHKIFKYQKTIHRLTRLIMGFISLRRSKILTTPSQYAKFETQKLTNSKITVIPNTALNNTLFKKKLVKRDMSKDIKIIMINNGFNKFKNVEAGLYAFKQFNLKYPTSSLHLFGSQMKKNESCYKWAQKMNLTNNVNFIGHLKHVQLMKIFNKFDILLHTSLEETFGTIYLEAMINGLPIVAGKYSGATKEIIKNNGILVDVSKKKEIVNALFRYANNSILWKKKRFNAYNYVKKNFNNKDITKKFLKIYKKNMSKI